MKAFLLAAGKGTRISKSIPEIPKCTLDVDGKLLVQRTVEMLIKNNIEVTIIVGYKHQCIRKALEGMPVNIVYNPFFDVTNSIGSLWMAKSYFEESDTLVANADVYWSQEVLDTILSNRRDALMLCDSSRVLDGDYFFYTENNKLLKFGKELKLEERNSEYVGIAYLSKDFINPFIEKLETIVGSQRHDCWWENVLYSYIGEREINTLDINGKFWAEIDFIEDYHRIIDYVASIEK